jgi:AraC-like DNA-binding protein
MRCELQMFLNYHHLKKDYVHLAKHSEYEIILYRSGMGKTMIDDIEYKFEHNSIAVITPETWHDETTIDDADVTFCIVKIENSPVSLMNTVLEENPLTKEIYELFLKIEAEVKYRPENCDERIQLMLCEIVLLLGRMLKSSTAKKGRFDIVDYIKRYLKQNYEGNVDLQKVAESLGYSYDRMRHIFKEQMGVSPVQYLMNLKIAKAKELLADKKNSIGATARLCGFKDASNFNSMFKARLEMTPYEYRKILQKDKLVGKEVSNFEENSSEGRVI